MNDVFDPMLLPGPTDWEGPGAGPTEGYRAYLILLFTVIRVCGVLLRRKVYLVTGTGSDMQLEVILNAQLCSVCKKHGAPRTPLNLAQI